MTQGARGPAVLPNLTPRSESVLKTLIEAYLVEGEPVGSRLLSRRYPEAVSPATLRNVMADLEEGQLLAQPHASAGRVPTELAYRWYVNRWVRPEPPPPELGAKLEEALAGAEQDPDHWLRHASRVLSEVMGGICVALPVRMVGSRLVRLEFVPLGPDRLVALWVGAGGDVEHQVMGNPWGFDASTLTELGNFATEHFRGLTFEAMRRHLLEALRSQEGEARNLRQRLSDITETMREPHPASEPPLVVSGLRELARMPEFEDALRFKDLVAAFEEHGRLAQLLNAFAEAASREVTLLLGSENPFLPDMPLATAMRTVPLGGPEGATFAFVGPLRLDYVRVVGALTWWSQQLNRRNLGSV